MSVDKVKFPAYIRTYGTSDYEHDIENYIKCLERHYKVELRDRPACIKVVNSLKTGLKDCKRQLREARKRKVKIIEKLLDELTWDLVVQGMRKTPEEAAFQALALVAVGTMTPSPSPATLSTRYTSYSPPSPTPTASSMVVKHPNTAVVSPTGQKEIISKPKPVEVILNGTSAIEINCPLPPTVMTNIHRLVSPLQSYEKIKCVNPPVEEVAIEVIGPEEWELLDKDTCLRVVIRRSNPFKGIFEFSLLNACSHILLVYYRGITDTSFFKNGCMRPRYMIRLVPGLSQPYQFNYTLKEGVHDYLTSLFFKVAKTKPRYDAAPLGPYQALLIPMTAFRKGETLNVTESVKIPPAYFWHVNERHGYPFGVVNIISKDIRSYIVNIVKCPIEFPQVQPSTVSIQEDSPAESSVSSPKTGKKVQSKAKPQKPSPSKIIIKTIVKEIIDNCLESFLFQHTYIKLPPRSKRYVYVYFTKAFHIGHHQAVYELKFINPKNDEVIFTKRVDIYAEALPIPIVINPHSILDLTQTPLNHGYCEGYFTITNTHNLYGSMISIRLTTKMEKLFTIYPTEVEIPRMGTIRFRIRFCTQDFIRNSASDKPSEYYAHFNIKISVRGMDVVYRGCPIIYYEIIAPCVIDYNKVYRHELTEQNVS